VREKGNALLWAQAPEDVGERLAIEAFRRVRRKSPSCRSKEKGNLKDVEGIQGKKLSLLWGEIGEVEKLSQA